MPFYYLNELFLKDIKNNSFLLCKCFLNYSPHLRFTDIIFYIFQWYLEWYNIKHRTPKKIEVLRAVTHPRNCCSVSTSSIRWSNNETVCRSFYGPHLKGRRSSLVSYLAAAPHFKTLFNPSKASKVASHQRSFVFLQFYVFYSDSPSLLYTL